jgi:hypothetical protein
MEYAQRRPAGDWGWQETAPLPSPVLPVKLEVHGPSYSWLDIPLPRALRGGQSKGLSGTAVPDTGAQMDVTSVSTIRSLGLDESYLFPVAARVFGASRDAEIDIIGGILLKVQPPGPNPSTSTIRMFYVARNVSRTYLSLSSLKALGVVSPEFPRMSALQQGSMASISAREPAGLPPCSNDGVAQPGEMDKPCGCPRRALPPTGKPALPCAPTEENLDALKQHLLDRYADSSFNVCEHQQLPMLKGSPPLELHSGSLSPTTRPIAVHRPAMVPLHWQEPVLQGLLRDLRLGVIERVPLNTPVRWQSRMHITAKHNGEPRRTVDYQAINDVSPRQTHHTQAPWHIVASIPEGVRKSCFDAFHGYHSLQLATAEDRDATTFITPWGRFRYKTCPQGFLSAGDAYTDRMDRLLQGMERQKRCIDDTLLWDDSIEASFFRACEFLDICGRNGVILNPKKFQFAESEVDFIGFSITASGVKPPRSFVDSIMDFPTPANITDVRSWFGTVAQVSYAFASSPVMQPMKHLLSTKIPFSWSPELEAAFEESKREVVRQCELGVRTFDPTLPTALATDWCKTGMGYWLTQKRCRCPGPEVKPGCCPTGWQTVYVGSRFCTSAETRYHPICGEAAAAAWGAEKCRFFLLGLPNFLLCLDHRPLLKIFSPKTELGAVTNPRLYNQKIRLLPFRFTPVFIPGKLHVTPDCYSRRSDFPEQPSPQPGEAINLLDIQNVQPDYAASFSPPAWVSRPQRAEGIAAALSAHPVEVPSEEETRNAQDWVEDRLMNNGQVSLCVLYAAADWEEETEVAGLRVEPVRMVTWTRLQEATAASPLCQTLLQLLAVGLPEDKQDWPESVQSYFPFRHNLISADGVIMCGERPLIPADLREEVLQHLHAAHHGVTRMLSRAAQSVWWPGLKAAITAQRGQCSGCVHRAPSNPAPPPADPVQPEFPFSHIVADFFQVDGTYLAMADRYSGWLSIYKLKKDDGPHIIDTFRKYFSRWGVAKDLTTDGASVFTSGAMKDFYDRWGVHHRVSSAYYPRANKRAEVAVKSAKRLVMENLGPGGSIDTDRFARALLLHRNNPDPETGVSAAQVIFGRELRDHLPAKIDRYQPRQEWRLEADLRERAMAKRHGRMERQLAHGSRALPPLSLGDCVVVQDQVALQAGKPGRWTKSGEIVEILPHDAYMIRMHGSRKVTQRNRRFLRRTQPFKPAIPVLSEDLAHSGPVTRAIRAAAQAERAAQAEALGAPRAAEAAPPLAPMAGPPVAAPPLAPMVGPPAAAPAWDPYAALRAQEEESRRAVALQQPRMERNFYDD